MAAENQKSTVVPFGKYKNQPLEALAADVDYVEWLREQPWFKEKFHWIDKQIVVVQHGSQEPQETPEHNRLQAMFLEKPTRLAVLSLCSSLFSSIHSRYNKRTTDKAAKIREMVTHAEEYAADRCEALAKDIEEWKKHHSNAYDYCNIQREEQARRSTSAYSPYRTFYRTKVETPEERQRYCDDQMQHYAEKLDATKLEKDEYVRRCQEAVTFCETYTHPAADNLGSHVEFETAGVDVTLSGSYWDEVEWVVSSWPRYSCGPESVDLKIRAVTEDIKIECKPHLGDDYPAVLRQMNANGSKVLVIGAFRSDAITLEQLRTFFKPKTVLTVEEIEAAIERLPEWVTADEHADE